MQPYGNAADQYLLQRINGASPEQLVAMLLEGGQRFLAQAIKAVESRDVAVKARMVNRVSAIIEELLVRLNHEDGGEVVTNLVRVYDWWLHELYEASSANQAARLERISMQMSALRDTWEELHQAKCAQGRSTALTAEGMVG